MYPSSRWSDGALATIHRVFYRRNALLAVPCGRGAIRVRNGVDGWVWRPPWTRRGAVVAGRCPGHRSRLALHPSGLRARARPRSPDSA